MNSLSLPLSCLNMWLKYITTQGYENLNKQKQKVSVLCYFQEMNKDRLFKDAAVFGMLYCCFSL